ncbi:hypothetical protein Glove_279g19 [Diversispora epigaea]|uniref:Methyltransferase domain-containing protein n=1 Tax=Diversispora epigaea TaxID=1348612 RepID=A0A397I290_9GLOM|nr:hypothetical protein Glove_279g19 [Diversispora epigaea]
MSHNTHNTNNLLNGGRRPSQDQKNNDKDNNNDNNDKGNNKDINSNDFQDRRYHNATNDIITMMNAQHELMRNVWKGDFISPIEEDLIVGGLHILDIGCGNGTWLLQLAQDYPLNNYTGIDMSPIFPKNIPPQSKINFIQTNILQGLPFESNEFDFVHMRFLNTSFTEKQWGEIVIPDLTRVTKPRRWLELCEIDMDGQSIGPTSRRMITTLTSYLESKGINGLIGEEIPDFLESTNKFSAIYSEEKFSKIGKWAGNLGEIAVKSFTSEFRSMKDLPKWMGIGEEEFNEMVDKCVLEFDDYRSYFISYRFYCQKRDSTL